MVFSSLFFLYCFFPVSIGLYLISPTLRIRNWVLTILSLFFYAWGEPLCLLLLIAQALIGYSGALIIDAARGKTVKCLAMGLSATCILSMLIVFKYADFLIENLNALTGLQLPATGLALPIGISFFSFQTLSYVIDVYRGQTRAQRFFPDLLLYVALFPQLIAGPILRYSDVEAELRCRSSGPEDMFRGLFRFSLGLGKKVLLANYAGSVASGLLDGGVASMADAWLGILLFAFQIYFDFSGYSDMAIGLGRMFGFHYPENFNLPYAAVSITDFWRRWHISMSTFFRDYVYIPMGGNRRHKWFNLLVTWFLTGLWHGASWNFILWGLYYCILLCMEKALGEQRLQRIPAVIRHALTLLLVLFGWMLFYCTDLSTLGVTLRSALGLRQLVGAQSGYVLLNNLPLILVCALGCTALPRLVGQKIDSVVLGSGTAGRRAAEILLSFAVIAGLVALCTISLVGESYNPFLYFRF